MYLRPSDCPPSYYDPEWAFGWGNRRSNWEFSGAVQQELLAGVSLNFGFFQRNQINLTALNDQAVGPDDFVTNSVTVPTDSRLPDGGGNTLSFVEVRPTSVRVNDEITDRAPTTLVGGARSWNGFDFTIDARVEGLHPAGRCSARGGAAIDRCDVQ